ncbi:2-dehydropantoate 2-reductase [Listeria sp. PSOL-1]|uniref:2-dehydropantoate 2-reductase n=1 Tax=Listeria sp. PSOL-1 TaxID=1844999 RepID=UPI0013D31B9B|nr:2-dehydropantoate 2-reductase [Listeria sp. PSOL-1]
MKIGMVGAGALGLLYSAKLMDTADVTLFARRSKQVDVLKREGIRLDEATFNVNVACSSDVSLLAQMDFLIMTVKAYQLESLLPILKQLPINLPVLFLQNGKAHFPMLLKLPLNIIFVGTSEHGALRQGENHVFHKGEGKTNFARWRGKSDKIETFLNGGSTFPFTYVENYQEMIDKKWLVNLIVNPLTAVLDVRNGELISNPIYFAFVQDLIEEVSPLLMVKDPLGIIQAICSQTAENYSSMAIDVKLKRETELDAILLPLLEMGAKKKVELPKFSKLYHALHYLKGENGC